MVWGCRCDNLDSKSMSLAIKVQFGSYCLVRTPASSTRTTAHQMAGYSVTQLTFLKMALQFRLWECSSRMLTNLSKESWTWTTKHVVDSPNLFFHLSSSILASVFQPQVKRKKQRGKRDITIPVDCSVVLVSITSLSIVH